MGSIKRYGIALVFLPVSFCRNTWGNNRRYSKYGMALVVGVIWQGIECEYQYPITRGDMGTIGEFTRDNVSKWLDRRAGDFESIIDFTAQFENTVIDWAK